MEGMNPLWVVLLSGLTGIRVSVASWVRLVAGFGGIMIVVLTAPDSAVGGAPWAVAAFCVAPILWAAGSLLTANVGRPVDRVAATHVGSRGGPSSAAASRDGKWRGSLD